MIRLARRSAESAHPRQPLLAPGIVLAADHADQAGLDASDAAEGEDVAFQALETARAVSALKL
jgi:hypothetical protein